MTPTMNEARGEEQAGNGGQVHPDQAAGDLPPGQPAQAAADRMRHDDDGAHDVGQPERRRQALDHVTGRQHGERQQADADVGGHHAPPR